jgi:hypothetical protein
MQSVNIALEGLCSISLFLMLLCSLPQLKRTEANRTFIALIAVYLVTLLSDLVSWAVPATPSFRILAYFSITLNYLSNYMLFPPLLVRYLSFFIIDRKKLMRNLIRLCDLIFILSSLAALVNLPFGFFFYLDENEAYVLGSWYWAANILPVVTLSCSALLILISWSLRQREK